jgi:hypothetical protein
MVLAGQLKRVSAAMPCPPGIRLQLDRSSKVMKRLPEQACLKCLAPQPNVVGCHPSGGPLSGLEVRASAGECVELGLRWASGERTQHPCAGQRDAIQPPGPEGSAHLENRVVKEAAIGAGLVAV